MAAQTFTLYNNGAVSLTVTGIQFNTPSQVTHAANLSNFNGGTTAFTGTTFATTTIIATGGTKTLTVDHYRTTSTAGTYGGTIVVTAFNGTTSTTATITTSFVVS